MGKNLLRFELSYTLYQNRAAKINIIIEFLQKYMRIVFVPFVTHYSAVKNY